MSATPEQLHEMLQYCIWFTRTMLERTGEFHPFGAIVSVDGRVAAVGGYNGEEHPAAAEIYKLLGEAFINGAKSAEYLGVALAANVNIPPQYSSTAPDGLRVHLESLGYARFIYVPYSLTKSGLFKKRRTVEFGDPFAVEIPPAFYSEVTDA